MNRPSFPLLRCALAILLFSGQGCRDEREDAESKPAAPPTVASLVPAATDLIVGMGAADHLVAVSNYDTDRDGTRGLPRVGDYNTFDWERLATLRPQVMIVFMTPDRMPEGLRQRAEKLGIRLMNVRTERLDDVYATLELLGKELDEEPKAAAAAETLRSRLERVRRRVEGQPRPRVLMVREKSASDVVGRENFLNDVLDIAGGENVIKAAGWPSIDREMLRTLAPEVVLHLLPEATPQVLAEVERTWARMDIPAVRDGRVHVVTEWYAQQPGTHLADLAERFAEALHPNSAATRE